VPCLDFFTIFFNLQIRVGRQAGHHVLQRQPGGRVRLERKSRRVSGEASARPRGRHLQRRHLPDLQQVFGRRRRRRKLEPVLQERRRADHHQL